tara:strand:+ start:774 stop:2186 length:1413 start_codon:yes stop_codon:yes gene_type:complete
MKPIQTLLKNRLIYFSLIILIAFFFSLYQINVENLWYDEIASFWVADPSLTYIETYSRVLNENTPSAYYFLIKLFFSFFSYDPDFLRIFNIPIYIISLIYFNLILTKISKNNLFIFFASALFVFNSFLISYTQEGRVFTFFCMMSLILINQYMALNQVKKNFSYIKLQYLFMFLIIFILLNTFIFSLLILGSIVFYELFFKKNKTNYLILSFIFISIFLFIILNYQFLLNLVKFESAIKQPNINFYYNFYFNQFFGSKLMGLIFLITFSWASFIFLKLKNKNENIKIFFIIIFFSYFVSILYGFLFKPVLQDKYIIYLVPVIIVIISYTITHNLNLRAQNILIIFLILLSFSNQILKNIKSDTNKPMFKSAIEKAIEIDKSKSIYVSYSDNKNDFVNAQMQNYFKHLTLVNNNNLSIINKAPNNNFFLICYDSSNTYNFCLKDSDLMFPRHQLEEYNKFYQVILFHYNKK